MARERENELRGVSVKVTEEILRLLGLASSASISNVGDRVLVGWPDTPEGRSSARSFHLAIWHLIDSDPTDLQALLRGPAGSNRQWSVELVVP